MHLTIPLIVHGKYTSVCSIGYFNGPVNVIEDIIYKLLSRFGEAVRHTWMVYRAWEFKSANFGYYYHYYYYYYYFFVSDKANH